VTRHDGAMSSPEASGPSRQTWVIIVVGALVVAALVALWWFVSDDDGPSATPMPATTPATSTASPSPSPSADEKPSAQGLPKLGEPRDVATDLAVPWGVAFMPDGDALVSERTTADIVRVSSQGSVTTVGKVPGVTADNEGGLLGIAVAPTFEQDQLIYAYFTTASDNRIVSMKLTSEGLGKPTVILDGIPRASYHDGGRLLFGPDGMLYASTGDHSVPDDAQDRGSLAGKILRMTPDGKVPDGNPFNGSLVWSYGHRNVQGLAFDDSGQLWATEFGDSTYDELNLIEPGANYGWPAVEGDGGAGAVDKGFVNPLLVWSVEDASPSGLAWRDGILYMGALWGERLWQIPVNGDRVGQPKAAFEGALGRIRTVEVTPEGDLWLTTRNTDGRGTVRPGDDRIVSVDVG
jgi:glucose/arabinose dehydrogenase